MERSLHSVQSFDMTSIPVQQEPRAYLKPTLLLRMSRKGVEGYNLENIEEPKICRMVVPEAKMRGKC